MELDELLKSFSQDLDDTLNSIKSGDSMVGRTEKADSLELVDEEDSCEELELVYEDESEQIVYDGIIFTDIRRLARKYGVREELVYDILEDYIEKCQKIGINWATAYFEAEDGEEWHSWQDYHVFLMDFMESIHYIPIDTALFIIGGEDVVPMPKIENPLPDVGSEYLDVDVRYCYPISSQTEQDDFDIFFTSVPLCYVGRLPLESGVVSTTISSDLGTYLQLCIEYQRSRGIAINGSLMTTTESWIPSSKEMMRDIPKVKVDSESLCVRNDMLISPEIDIEDVECESEFEASLCNADFLVFNLHGSDDYESVCYYGEDRNHRFYPPAFNPALASDCHPKIITTTSCYGARFIGYDRAHSMLLNSIYSGTMMFVGSCTTALGRGNGDLATDLLIPAGMSESMLRLYNLYLNRGYPGGYALLKAKVDYYKTCSQVDGCNEALATFMMFNFYGNPLLNMLPKLDQNYEEKMMVSLSLDKNSKMLYNPVSYSTVYSKKLDTAESILSTVRGYVDTNLSQIHQMVQDNLYNVLGLEKKFLENISGFGHKGKIEGYSYTYRMKSGPIERMVIARTDEKGQLKDIINTK